MLGFFLRYQHLALHLNFNQYSDIFLSTQNYNKHICPPPPKKMKLLFLKPAKNICSTTIKNFKKKTIIGPPPPRKKNVVPYLLLYHCTNPQTVFFFKKVNIGCMIYEMTVVKNKKFWSFEAMQTLPRALMERMQCIKN